MSPVVILLIAVVAASVVGVLVLVGVRAAKLSRELDEAEHKIESLQADTRRLHVDLSGAWEERNQAREAYSKQMGWIEHAEGLARSLEAELERRPKITRKTYRILTLGMKATGKTSLTLKWANPLIDLGLLEGTKIERYERTVSLVHQKDAVVEQVFEVNDWGGEHIVDALQQLIVDEIHGLLIVVDLGGKNAKHPDPARIQEQLLEFQPQALRFFFAPKMVASCKTAVLFINKSDLIPGMPAEVEEQAKRMYTPLIENLTRHATQVDIRVLVGSASYGHSTHLLFSHFVERILPKNAYDNQLLQRMKSDFSATRVPGIAPPLPAIPPSVAPAQATGPLPPGANAFDSPSAEMSSPASVATAPVPAPPPPPPPAGPGRAAGGKITLPMGPRPPGLAAPRKG